MTKKMLGPAIAGLAAWLALACSSEPTDKLSGDPFGGGNGLDGGVGDDGGSIVMYSDGGGQMTVPFEPVSPASYTAKVKNLINGLPVTDAEVAAVAQDPTALRGLIDTWMATPEFQGKMIEFFRNAFQQNQVDLDILDANLGYPAEDPDVSPPYQSTMVQTLEDTFPLTVWQLVASGQPLTQAFTTDSYVMTTAEMSMLSYFDEIQVNDLGKATDRLIAQNELTTFTFDPKGSETLAQTLDPKDPKYMVWADPAPLPASCKSTAPLVFDGTSGSPNELSRILFRFLFGTSVYPACTPYAITQPPIFTPGDFSDYRLVKIVPATASDETTPLFWDVLSLRAANQMTLHVPRIGYSGTLAFEANWGTNASNESRVTANQSLIVGTGISIDGENVVTTFPVNATDADHASNAACAGCHSQIDPLKQYFRQSYSLYYSDQPDQTQLQTQAGFNIGGVNATGTGVHDLMATMATHPHVAMAWAQKLQFWATSTAAEESDPEMQRIASAFATSNFDFKTLVREVMSSPLVTFASATQTTTDNGVLDSISRRDHFCAALSNRLNLADVCSQATPTPNATQKIVGARAGVIAVDTYYRDFALPSLPTDPDLFFRSAVEKMCTTIATEVVDVGPDAGTTSLYSSSNSTQAISQMVQNVMGIPPSDPRYSPTVTILTNHLNSITGVAGGTATDALQSTFALACMSPPSVLLGL